jgi:ElaB/YqjD/DUF883 family membrane-anchored ribosome-binding protein
MFATEGEVRNPAPSKDAGNRIVDATTCATHLAHEAQLAKSMIHDTVEDKIYAAKRALKIARRRVEQLEDYNDDAIRYVRRRPFVSLAIALASGLMIGAGVSWVATRQRRCHDTSESLIENR